MKPNIALIKQKFQLFDKTGLSLDQIRVLQVLIWGVLGGTVWANITGGAAMTSYMKELGASDTLYGFVFALPPLANAFQFLASYWMERTLQRTKMFLVTGFIQRLVWLPFALVPVFIPMSHPQIRLMCAVILAVLSAGMAPFMNVSFFSLFNDAVPLNIRGRYLASRSRIATVVGLGMGLVVARLLDTLPVYTNYVVVFLIAAVFGTFDICCFLLCRLPEMQPRPEKARMLDMIKGVLADKRYMRIVLSITCWLFSVQIGSPFFSVYTLAPVSEGGMGMTMTQVISTGQIMYNLGLILCIAHWGRAMDSYGSKPVLVVAAFLTAFMPAIWFRIGPGMLALAAFGSLYSGATYCAVDLSQQNLFMSQAPDKNRSMYFAVYFIFTQLVGLALGSIVGGFMLDNVLIRIDSMHLTLGGLAFNRYHAMFVLTMVLRLLSALLLLARIDDGAPGQTGLMIRNMVAAPGEFSKKLRYVVRQRLVRMKYHKQRQQEGGTDD